MKQDKPSTADRAAFEPYRDDRRAADAYTIMAPFGVTPSSSAAAIHRAGLKAQKGDGHAGDIAAAWRELRNIEKRLALDLLYHQPGGFTGQGAAAAEPAVPLPEPPPLDLPPPGPPDLSVFSALAPAPIAPAAIADEAAAPRLDLPIWDLAVDLVARLPASTVVLDVPDSFLDHLEEER